jgi:hypothetical protein
MSGPRRCFESPVFDAVSTRRTRSGSGEKEQLVVDQVIKREIGRAPSVTTTRVRGLQVATVALVIVAAVALSMALGSIDATPSGDAATPTQAESARWAALVAAEYPFATAGVKAQSDRWTALAAAYDSGAVLPTGALAEAARWQGLADSYTRARTTETARWNALADHHLAHPPALQAWADRYEGLADTSD